MPLPTVLGDMHHAAVAGEELRDEGEPGTATQIAERLGWRHGGSYGGAEPLPDYRRAQIALLAAEDHDLWETR